MKQLDLMIIGGVAVLALFLEAGAAAHAPSASVDQLALYEAVQMHQYMTVTDPRPSSAPHGLKQAGRRMARSHGKTRTAGKRHHGNIKHSAHAKKKH
jgi:hypothetical protein